MGHCEAFILLSKCIIFLCTYLQERITARDPNVDMTPATLALFHDMCDVILNENYCSFANRTFRAVKGFPTGLACGRTFAEIYLHMIERQLWSNYSASMSFARRYIDDGTAVFPDEISARAFIDAYGKLDPDVKITSDISSTDFVMLDTTASKGPEWERTGKLDLALYEKPDSAFLYIPAFSDIPSMF